LPAGGKIVDQHRDDILSLLSAARRAEIIAEALSGVVHELLATSADKTVGAFVDELQQHPHWEALKQLPAALVLGGAAGFAASPKGPAPKSPSTAPKASPPKADGPKLHPVKNKAKTKNSGNAETLVLEAVKAGNDLRSVDIVRLTKLAPNVVGKMLANLRNKKLVKGEGYGKGTTYSVV
jgi:hypothetical protein